jgi:PKD repeat protein
MKYASHIFFSRPLLFALLAIGALGCLKYKDIPDCDMRAGFQVTQDTFICSGTSCEIQFTDSSEAFTGMEYEWDFRDGSQKVFAASPQHAFAPNNAAPYRVLLTVRLGEGCMDTFSRNIWVLDGGPAARFSTDKAMNMCFAKESVTFTNESENATSYVWNFGDNSSPLSANNKNPVTHTYSVAGTYSVTLTATGNGRTNTATVEVVVKVPTFLTPFTTGKSTANEVIIGIDEGSNGDFHIAICNGKVCFFPKFPASGTKPPNFPDGVSPLAYTSLAINNFKKTDHGYILIGNAAGASGGNRKFAYKVGLDFQGVTTLNLHPSSGAGGQDEGFDVAVSNSNGFLFCGRSSWTVQPEFNSTVFSSTPVDFSALQTVRPFLNEPSSYARAILNYGGGYLVAGLKKTSSGSVEAGMYKLKYDLSPVVNANTTWGSTNYFINDILPLQNGKYALVGNDADNGRIRVVDEDGAMSWDKPFSGWKITQAILTLDKRLIVVGKERGSGIETKMLWFELDLNTGERKGPAVTTLPTDFLLAEATCIAATSDGGFIIGGFGTDQSGKQQNILLKTDSKGNQ